MNFKKTAQYFVILLSVLFFTTLFKSLRMDPNSKPSAHLGRAAPLFNAKSITKKNESVNLNDLKGKLVVLNFWASWCTTCKEEARDLEAFWQKIKNQDKIKLVAIAVQDEEMRALEFAKKMNMTFDLAIDSVGNISVDYGVTGVPETYIIDTKGIVKFKHTGPITLKELERYTREI